MKTQNRRLGNVEFFKVCELARDKREHITSNIHSYRKLAEYLTAESGIEISDMTVPTILETVGIALENKSGLTVANENRTKTIRIIVRAFCNLLDKLGDEIDPDLLDLYQRQFGKPFVPTAKVAGIPLKNVQPSSRIPTVTLKD